MSELTEAIETFREYEARGNKSGEGKAGEALSAALCLAHAYLDLLDHPERMILRPLVWACRTNQEHYKAHESPGIFGIYLCDQESGGKWVSGILGTIRRGRHDSLESAKAACFADYCSRVLPALVIGGPKE